MPNGMGPRAADSIVAWIVGAASVGCAVLIASSLSYLYWHPLDGWERRAQTAAQTQAEIHAKPKRTQTASVEAQQAASPAPVPAPKPRAQMAGPAHAVPLPDRKPQIPDADENADTAALAPETGAASWYDFGGAETANGETMDEGALTAAHPTLPFGTRVTVENVATGESVVVRINDRGPHAGGRIIDLSQAAAEALGMIDDGVAHVRVAPVEQ